MTAAEQQVYDAALEALRAGVDLPTAQRLCADANTELSSETAAALYGGRD